MTENECKYIYGVIKNNGKKQFDSIASTGEERVYVVDHQELGCVVSDSLLMDYRSLNKEELARDLVAHQTVIENVMKEATIVPMKFGTLLNNSDEVGAMLKSGYPTLAELLHSMEDKMELDVTAAWNDLNAVVREIGEEDEEIKNFKKQIANKSIVNNLKCRMKIGSMVHSALSKRREALKEDILRHLDKASVGHQSHDLMDDKMILNCGFLLDKRKEENFDQRLHELDERYGRKITFRCVGPLPPYSFATCEVKKADFKKLDRARKVLGLSEESTLPDIKSTYRNLIREKHPDRFPSDPKAQKTFEEIQSAYQTLLDFCPEGKVSFRKDDVMGAFTVARFDVAGTRTDNR